MSGILETIQPEMGRSVAGPLRVTVRPLKIAYFVHDLSDAAVARRIRMLALGGAQVTPIGFRRGEDAIGFLEETNTVDLGQTHDKMLVKRVVSVLGALSKVHRLEQHLHGADVILARNLEMLIVAVFARAFYAPKATVIYECLDIHTMLLSKRLAGHLLRMIETKLWDRVDLLLTSSPAFVQNYFRPRGFSSPIRLVENKVVLVEGQGRLPAVARVPRHPPWRIGWLGIIRCRRSLEILSSLARAMDGAVEIVIRGRPLTATFSDFEAEVRNLPHLQFGGSYRNPTDLPHIYGGVHFSWAIDYYEQGRNSAWLLPNRIYEGSLYGAVPIALADAETGHWVLERDAGVALKEPLEQNLIDFFRSLDNRTYSELAKHVESIPRADLVDGQAECCALVEVLRARGFASATLYPDR